jgi:glycosyltransferase involved in cell wall biosynthesis
MLVSVVVPAFNAEQWIADSLKSVLNQSHTLLEIIVVDDGSTDQTSLFAERTLTGGTVPYQIIRQGNQGAACARNRGWQAAKGEWIQFLDADDLLEPTKIKLQVASATKDNSDVIYSDWQKLIFDGKTWTTGDVRSPIIKADALADIISDRNFLQLGSLLIKKSVLKRVQGFDTKCEPIEDVGLCIKIAIAGGIFLRAHSERPMSLYRDAPRSFSKKSQTKFIESCLLNAKLTEEYVRENKNCSPRIVEAIVNCYFFGARFFAGRDWKRFDEIVADIEGLSPRFVPTSPRYLKKLSHITGYRRAERLVACYRSIRGVLAIGAHAS